jgi:hypothetical protein
MTTILAGSGVSGSLDGMALSAQFNSPYGLAIDGAGSIVVAEENGNRLRKISSNGLVTTIAGGNGIGLVDGIGASAQFSYLNGITIDPSGKIIAADIYNNSIRAIVLTPTSSMFSDTVFTESTANDGRIPQKRIVKISGDTWSVQGNLTPGVHFYATGVPSGLICAANAISSDSVELSFTGQAVNHDVSNNTSIKIVFLNQAVNSGIISAIKGVNGYNLTGQTYNIAFVDGQNSIVAPSVFSSQTPSTTGLVGNVYTSYTFIANGTPAPTYSVASGSLPTGLTLSSAGVLSGTPTASG